MSLSLLCGALWVLVATIVAFLPMRFQYAPGFGLLTAAPVLLGWIAYNHGWWWFAGGVLAFISMFRNPLLFLLSRARGETPEIPT